MTKSFAHFGALSVALLLGTALAEPSVVPTGVTVYNSASAFASALTTTFNGTNKIFRLVAVGQYNSASNTFVASRIDVSLQET